MLARPFNRSNIFLNATKHRSNTRLHKTGHLWLTTPDLISNTPNKLQLVLHIVPFKRVTLSVRRKATLRADTDLLERRLAIDTVALCDEIRGLVHALDHVGFVLQLWELGRHDTEDDILVRGQLLEGLETAGARGVVFEVVSVDVEVLVLMVSVCLR